MSHICKYCTQLENKQDNPGLECQTCMSFVHLSCLRRLGTPGDFACDVFFDFICAECSPSSEEVFKRNKLTWVHCLFLTLNQLKTHMQGISNNGFFHYKTHICSFVDRYWVQLFGSNFKQKKNWVGTIAGALSIYNNVFFQSGSVVLKESGWWKMLHNFSPAAAAGVLQELSQVLKDSKKTRGNKVMFDPTLFKGIVAKMGFEQCMVDPEKCIEHTSDVEDNPSKKRRLDTDEHSRASTSSVSEPFDTDMKHYMEDSFEKELINELTNFTTEDNYTDVTGLLNPYSLDPSDSSSLHSKIHYDSDSLSSHNHTEYHSDEDKPKENRKTETRHKKTEDKPVVRNHSLFSALPNSTNMPWEENWVETTNLVPMTEYEEVQLLKNIENIIPKVKDAEKKAELCQIKAKLSLRRLKRHHHLPMFDLDKTVKILGGYVAEDPRVGVNTERILDRFQRTYLIDNLCGTISSTSFGTLLLPHIEPTPFRSVYSSNILKPYIRRDSTSTPTWLKIRDELLKRTHRHIKEHTPPPRGSIDYCYVRPQHIPAINSLCTQFFWPGIDLSEALEYPEFSCVVTYKKLVIAFAFLVPDVGHNEAYISFVLTRPEWRNAKIASFMLYHLLQTCTDQDVTLHVSPTNPAIFLYQKFGFKVEELIQDFYEKYYDIDHKGCRHALFLRLVR